MTSDQKTDESDGRASEKYTKTSSDLVRNYRFLFTLPRSTWKLYLSTIVLAGLALMLETSKAASSVNGLAGIFFSGILIQLILIEFFLIILRSSPIVNRRRLAGSFMFVNLIWTFLALSSLYIIHNPESLVATVFLITCVTFSFSLLIVWPLFTRSFLITFAVGLVDLLPQWIVISKVTNIQFYYSTYFISVFLLALILVMTMIITLHKINNSTKERLGDHSFDFLKGFMDSWMNSDSSQLESMISKQGTEKTVKTILLELVTESGKKLSIIIPYIHPGPFYPVGSYDLPSKIMSNFTSLGYDNCFVLHGPVDHTFNLQSKHDTDEYVRSLNVNTINENFGYTLGLPICKDFDSHQLISLRFDNSILLFISAWPGGSEDYPPSFTESVEKLIDKETKIIVIDSHNALGETPDQDDVNTTIKAIYEAIPIAQSNYTSKFYASFSSISKAEAALGDDVGTGGIGVLLIETGTTKSALVVADANNATAEVKDRLKLELVATGIELIELATSDTHFNATRIRNERGYLLLGESTPPDYISKLVVEECKKLSEKLEPSKFRTHVWTSKVKVGKNNTFQIFRDSIQRSIRYLIFDLVISAIIILSGYFIIGFLL